MEKNKTGKYFKYAVGEIVLVVIGILIALSINNWNEQRKFDNAETYLLTSLNNEFRLNKTILEKDIVRIDSTISYLSILLKLMNKTVENNYTDHSLDSIIFYSLTNHTWEPSNFTLKEIENSSNLSNLKNKELGLLLYDWASYYQEIEKRESYSATGFDHYLNLIKQHGSLRQLDRFGIRLPEGGSILRPNNRHLLKNPEFENAVNDHMIFTRSLKERYKNAVLKLDVIIKITDKYITS
jgi:hypothetical protein